MDPHYSFSLKVVLFECVVVVATAVVGSMNWTALSPTVSTLLHVTMLLPRLAIVIHWIRAHHRRQRHSVVKIIVDRRINIATLWNARCLWTDCYSYIWFTTSINASKQTVIVVGEKIHSLEICKRIQRQRGIQDPEKGKKRRDCSSFLFGSQLQIASATCGNFFVWLA